MYSQKWRTYGGTKHLEENNNVTLQSLVVNNFTLTNDYLGLFSIQGQLTVSDVTNLNAALFVGGNQTNTGNLLVNGTSTFTQIVTMMNNLYVSGSVIVNGTVTVSEDFILTKNIVVGGNMYAENNTLVLGYNTSTNTSNTNSSYSGKLICNNSHSGGFMGINFPDTLPILPAATFDIYSDSLNNPTTTTALNVHSTGNKTQSVVSSNASQQGVVVYTDNSQCSLHIFSDTSYITQYHPCEHNSGAFYNNTLYMTDVSANYGDATLVYTSGGNLSVSVENNINVPSGLSVGKSSSGNMHTSLSEKVSIYSDMSFGFLENYYEKSNFYTQNAVSLVATMDTSCVTGLNIMLPSGKGQRMMAGSYIYDSNRSMAISGLITDTSCNWTPNQMVVSNSNPVYGKTVTAFNTYQPVLDSYVVTINGPTQLTNGEINLIQDVSFHIVGAISSPRYPNYVLAFGSHDSYDSSLNNYHFPIKSSTNGGKIWKYNQLTNSNTLFTNLNANLTNVISSGYVYDNMYSVVTMNHGGFILVSCDGFQTWNPLLLYDAFQNSFAYGCSSVRILDAKNSANFLVFTYTSSSDSSYNHVGWVYMPYHSGFVATSSTMDVYGNQTYVYTNSNTIINTSYVYNSFDTYMNKVFALDEYDTSYVFVVGTGIKKYSVQDISINSTLRSSWHVNGFGGSYTYYAMQTYKTYQNDVNGINRLQPDAFFSLFVGGSVITYTLDGGNTFVDVSMGFSDYCFTNVTIYDISRAIVIGSRYSNGTGIILTTYNRGVSWNNSYPILNMSGTANLLMDAIQPHALVSICKINLDDFLIVRNNTSNHWYDPSGYNDTFGYYGNSQIYYCHVPCLFDRNAHVLDICGSMQISGSLVVEDNLTVGGTITGSTQQVLSDYRIKSDVVNLDDFDYFTVDNLRPVFYNNNITHCSDVGFIAHEVQDVFPFLVHGIKDDLEKYQSINYNGLIGILVKEIQNLKRLIGIGTQVIGTQVIGTQVIGTQVPVKPPN